MTPKTFPNQVVYPRAINPWEFPPIDVTLNGLDANATNELVHVRRFKIDDDSSFVLLTSTSAIVGNVVTVGALFSATETNRPSGTYRLEIRAAPTGQHENAEQSNLLVRVTQ